MNDDYTCRCDHCQLKRKLDKITALAESRSAWGENNEHVDAQEIWPSEIYMILGGRKDPK